MQRLIIARKISQTAFLVVFIYILWSATYPLKAPVSPAFLFKIDPLLIIATSVSERILLPGLFASAVMLIIACIAGRFFCGWICPLGTAIDITGVFNRRVGAGPAAANAAARKIKFFIVGAIGGASFLGAQLAWILDPMGIMARFVSLNLIPAVISVAKPLYGSLEPALLRMRPHFFAHSLTIFLLFAFVCGLALVRKRLWCRSICPLGALYAIPGRFAALRRVVDVCSGCKKCESVCRMGAINDDASYIAGECILCMDCLYGCPEHAARFTWHVPWDRPAAAVKHSEKTPLAKNEPRLTRGKFLFLALSSLGLSGFSFREKDPSSRTAVIRPPAALIEEEFVDRCVRCGNCMKVCVTNGLQPTLFQAGLGGIWTPRLVPEIGHCEYQCALCGETCPTGAIPAISVERKRSLRLGLAEIDHSICLPWAEGRDCVVCEEYCPLPGKAIRLVKERRAAAVLSKPYIDERLCIGCGICQNKCPTRPIRAVRVSPRQSDRTRGGKDHGRFS